MRVMEGQFTSVVPYKAMNIHNTSLQCKCRFITLKEMENKKMQFLMEAKCLKHIIKYAQWKMASSAVFIKGLKINYTYNEMSDGSTEAIK